MKLELNPKEAVELLSCMSDANPTIVSVKDRLKRLLVVKCSEPEFSRWEKLVNNKLKSEIVEEQQLVFDLETHK